MSTGRKQIFAPVLLIFVTSVLGQNVTSSTSSDATTNTSETLFSSSISSLTTISTTTTNNSNKDSDNSITTAVDDVTASVIPLLEEDNVTTVSSSGSAEPGATPATETSVTSLELNADNATTLGLQTDNATTLNGSDLDTNSTENATETGLSESSSFLGGTVDLQTQVYIISGTFGLVAFLLIVLLLSLAFSVAKIKDQLLDTESRYIVDREDRVRGYQNGGYHGGDMVQHGGPERSVDRDSDTRDLSKMGYSIYSGNRQQSSDNIPMQNVSRSHMMKYEEGVIPINSEHDDR